MNHPLTFRTSPGSYAVPCGVLSIPLITWVAAYLARGVFDPAALTITVLLPSTAAVWLAYFRLQLDDSSFEYRDLFGTNFRVPYAEITGLRTEWLRGRYPQWKLHLKDGRRFRINLKPFPRSAYEELAKRLTKPA